MSFFYREVSREKGKLVRTVYRKPTFSSVYTHVYRKPTFSSVYTHFESFMPRVYKFGMVYTLAYCCFKIGSDSTNFHEELIF